jgi:glycine reductase complex component B subunit gamma
MAMEKPLHVVHYVNQFFGGLGGEDTAGVGVSFTQGVIGAGRALQQVLTDRGTVIGTLVCGDNYMHDQRDSALSELESHLQKLDPDVLIAGPAFASGRYGLACLEICKVALALGVPAVTGMHPENPAAQSLLSQVVIAPTGETASDMVDALTAMTRLALKLGLGEKLGPAEIEGYMPRGIRHVHDRQLPGYQRALDMLLSKLHNGSFISEVPIHIPERVPPVAPLVDLARATIAIVTTGGLVRRGNPDKQVSSNARRYHRHSVADLRSLSGQEWEAYHAGYFNQIVNSNPNYILPLNFLRDLEGEGSIGQVYEWIYALPGVSTPVAIARRLGQSIAQDLQNDHVNGCLLVAT